MGRKQGRNFFLQFGVLFILKRGIKEVQGVINGAYQITRASYILKGLSVLCF